jgi:hypothetical protein
VSFQNPVVGGDTLIRAAIQSPNYRKGLAGWAVNADGSAEFNGNLTTNGIASGPSAAYDVIAANKQLIVAGVDIQKSLTMMALGSAGGMFYNTGSTTRTTVLGTERMLIQTSFQWQPNRQWYLHLSAIRAQLSAAPNNMWWIVRWCKQSAGNVTSATATGGSGMWLAEHRFSDANAWHGLPPIFREISGIFDGVSGLNPGDTVNIALSVNGSGSATASFFPGDNWWMNILDMGPRVTASGVDLYTTQAPALTYKTFQTVATDSQSFQGGGAASNGSGTSNTDRMYYGQDPGYAPNGNWRSYAWYNKADTGGGNGAGGSLNDMSGASAVNVSYLDLYVTTTWWYQTSGGGTLYIGHTTGGVNHSSEPGGTYQEISSNFGGRGVGQWVSLLNTPLATAILNGTFTGIILGPGPSTSYNYYGYADGPAHGTPTIRAGYYK